MTGRERAILDVLEDYGAEIPISELAERTGLDLRPRLLTECLQALFDEGHIRSGEAPDTVRLALVAPTGRFIRATDRREANA
jgi:hypothetical protein